MDMVERVARAIGDKDMRVRGGFDKMLPEWQEYYRGVALAAFEAMWSLAPSEAEDAAAECGCAPSEFVDGWQAQIDSILKSTRETQ